MALSCMREKDTMITKGEEPYIDGIETYLDDILELTADYDDEEWCLHPNGTSVWVGDSYEHTSGVMVVGVDASANASSLARLMYLSALHPKRMRLLLERARGLSPVTYEQGQEDADEICAVCGRPTAGGHTHKQCYDNGVSDGLLDTENAAALGEVVSGYFAEALPVLAQHIAEENEQLRKDVGVLVRALAHLDGVMGSEQQAAYDRLRDLG